MLLKQRPSEGIYLGDGTPNKDLGFQETVLTIIDECRAFLADSGGSPPDYKPRIEVIAWLIFGAYHYATQLQDERPDSTFSAFAFGSCLTDVFLRLSMSRE